MSPGSPDHCVPAKGMARFTTELLVFLGAFCQHKSFTHLWRSTGSLRFCSVLLCVPITLYNICSIGCRHALPLQGLVHGCLRRARLVRLLLWLLSCNAALPLQAGSTFLHFIRAMIFAQAVWCLHTVN